MTTRYTEGSDADTVAQIAREAFHADDKRRDLLERVASRLDSDAKQDEKYQALQEIGKSAAASIAEMVAALECDYERLEELKEKSEQTDCEANPATGSPLDADEQGEFSDLWQAAGDCESREDAEQRIQEDPLSVQVRNGWHDPGVESEPEEFEILLSTGGPATRIIGELDEHCQPTRARLQAQDWFTQWTDYTGDAISQDDLLTYCRCFYFGE